MEEWKEYKLGDITVMKNGKKRPQNSGCYPVFGGNGIMDYSDSYNSERTIVIGRVGAYCGCVYKSEERCWVSDNAIAVYAKDNVDFQYLYYMMTSLDFHHHHIGGAQPLMTQDIIGDFIIKLPPFDTQRQIASILSSLDDKIENNRKINANLEAQAQALFKSWLNRCTEEVSIGDLSQNVTDYSKCNCERVVLINSSDVTEGRFEHHVLSENKNLKGHFKKRFQKGDILYSQVRPRNRHWGYCTFDADNYLASTQLMIIRNKSDILPSILLYQYMIDDNVWKEFTLKTETRSGTFPQGNYEDLSSIRVPFRTDVKEISDKLETIYSMIYTNEQESRRLASLRDTLLPRLMSGELKVNDINI
jgi:type I restriction enzyme S subunit